VILAFHDFELDAARFELRRGGAPVRIEPRVLEVLLCLASRRDRVVSKHELIEQVWGVKFVSESALTRCIHEARRALGDEAPEPTVIKTIHGRGYRFIAPVELRADGGPSLTAEARFQEAALASATMAPPHAPGRVRLGRPGRVRPLYRAGLAALGAALTAALAWLVATRGGPSRQRETGAESMPGFMQLTAGIQDAVKPAYSPDGETLLFVSHPPDRPSLLDIYLMPATGGSPRRLTTGVGASGDLPVFTADGSRIVFSRFRGGEDGTRLPDLWEVSRFGGEPRLFLERASGAGFSASGEWVAYTRHFRSRAPLWISPVSALDEHRQLAELGFVPRWSPSGEWVAFTTSNPQGGRGHLWIVSPATGERRRLTNEPHQVYGLSWARDGQSIIFAARVSGFFQLWQVGTSGGYTAPLTTGVGEYSSPSVARDGKTLAFCHSQPLFTLVTVEGPGKDSVKEVAQLEHHLAPRLSPTGWRIASAIRRPDFDEALHVTDLLTQKQVRLSDHCARQPSWLSDDEIAYLAPHPGGESTEVRIVNVSTGMRFAWTRLQGDASWLAVSPDKTRLAFASRSPDGTARILVRDSRDRQEWPVTSGGEYECLRWSPDGKRLSWSGPVDTGDRESNGIWMAEAADPRPIKLVPDGYGPVWSKAGHALAFTRFGSQSGLWQLDLDSRRLVRLREWDDVSTFDLVDERLVYIRTAGRSQIFSMPLDQ
jgi:Tol biopolymer transport system component/DNA-binding winged helix-turn-helix (wHTH) protein